MITYHFLCIKMEIGFMKIIICLNFASEGKGDRMQKSGPQKILPPLKVMYRFSPLTLNLFKVFV